MGEGTGLLTGVQEDRPSYPWDAALFLGVQCNMFQVILSKPFMRKAELQEGCQLCVRIE